MLFVFYNILQIYFFFQNIPTSTPARAVVGHLLRPGAPLWDTLLRPRATFTAPPRDALALVPSHLALHPALLPAIQRTSTRPASYTPLWHISRKCVTPRRPEPAFHASPAGGPLHLRAQAKHEAAPRPLQGAFLHPPSTHFRPNGPLWHFSRKCVTPPVLNLPPRSLWGT